MKKKVNNDEITNLIKIFGLVATIFIVFLGITYLMTSNKELEIPKPTYSNEIQFSEILVGEILTRNASEYYVLAFLEDDTYATVYDAYLTKMNEKSAIKRYDVNLDRFFNVAYVAEKSNVVEKLIFSETTVLKVKDGKVVEVYEGKEDIIKYLAGKVK